MTGTATAPYPERHATMPGAFDRRAMAAWGGLAARFARAPGSRGLARNIAEAADAFAGLTDGGLLARAGAARPGLLRPSREGTLEAFALVHAAVQRHLGMRYHPVQLAGGLALTGRRIVEMATGEGKTITAALPAAAFALSGRPVHVVTVNDYLAERDAERLRPVYAALGLTVALVREGDEPPARREAYGANITYVTNKELTFDYLKDRIATLAGRGSARNAVASLAGGAPRQLALRGLHAAVIDEADSVLIDEARTPLIISAERGGGGMADAAAHALEVARALSAPEHFVLDVTDRLALLTPAGQDEVERRSAGFIGMFGARQAREQFVTQGLSALHLFERDRHYIVADGKVQIVDEYTGRTMPDRTWEAGLHQLIETKEAVALTGERETLARITYQRFFNRYLHLSGMTGTGREVAGELRAVYGLSVVRLPTNRPVQRRHLGAVVTQDAAAKWDAVALRVRGVSAAGRPVLVGTQSVEASEALSAVLAREGVAHVVLNARQDAHEAEVVGRAGQPGQVTVATNMAGRGTDIELSGPVRTAGGLHVLLTGFHDSTRVDRQLYGRAGRQGDPGSCEAIVALDDELFRRFAPRLARALAGMAAAGGPLARLAARLLQRRAQRVASGNNAQIRRQQMAADEQFTKGMGFAGRE